MRKQDKALPPNNLESLLYSLRGGNRTVAVAAGPPDAGHAKHLYVK
jgi:hypothetical protein